MSLTAELRTIEINFLKASGVVNTPTKYFMIKCFGGNNGKMCLKLMTRDKNISNCYMKENMRCHFRETIKKC